MIKALGKFLTPGRRKAVYKLSWIVATYFASKGVLHGDEMSAIKDALAVFGFAVADFHTVKEPAE